MQKDNQRKVSKYIGLSIFVVTIQAIVWVHILIWVLILKYEHFRAK